MTESISFDRAVDYYDTTRGFPPGQDAPIAALFAQAGSLDPASRVLEIGVGTGRIALPLSAHIGTYVGADISLAMMERLRAKRTTQRILLTQGDAARLPFAPGSFTAVVIVHVLHLVPSWETVLDDLARVLRPDGLLLHGWNRYHTTPFDDVWREAMNGLGIHTRTSATEGWIERFVARGWSLVGEPLHQNFTVERTPQGFLEMARNRRWSSTWALSDEQLQVGLDAVQAYIDAHYPDPTRAEAVETGFTIQAHRPPR